LPTALPSAPPMMVLTKTGVLEPLREG